MFLWYNEIRKKLLNFTRVKLKNINLTLSILTGLIFISFAFFVVAQEKSTTDKNIFLDSDQDGLTNDEEKTYGTDPNKPDTDGDGYNDGSEIKAGYNPLKKAPGDKLTDSNDTKTAPENVSPENLEEENLTQKVAQKISVMANTTDTENQAITMDDVEEMINSTMNTPDELPQFSQSDIIIKKQNYDNLSPEKAKKKRKADVADYSVAVLYILTSNSPEPLTSSSDMISSFNKIVSQLLSALSSGDPSGINNLSRSGEKILEQLKKVEVPEDMIETQIKALQYASYSQKLKSLIEINPEDPLANLANYSKIQTFVESLISFFDEIKTKLDEYEIQYADVQDKINGLGIDLNIEDSSIPTSTPTPEE